MADTTTTTPAPPIALVSVTIDGVSVQVEKGRSILQACEAVGIEIPRFCYHDRLSVPANCRMCLVEVEGARKPVPSCAETVRDGLVIRTRGDLTRAARQGVMEMLLINHPLDCPICDQGGECDLQDQAVAYGFDRSRYLERKRAVEEKDFGPLVATKLTRCIHCTRCVRFMEEIAGTEELAMIARGEWSEIGTFTGDLLTSELQGNVIDVCPVGALTSAPYEFKARPWELRRTQSVDVLDAVGSNIRVDVRGNAVMRILPVLNEDVNEEWLADKSRFAYDALLRRRLDRPYLRRDGRLQAVGWDAALAAAAAALTTTPADQIAALAGDLCDAESMVALMDLMDQLGSPHLDCRQDGARYDVSHPSAWRFNSTIAGIEAADAILLVGTFPRWEAPLINARIRKRWLAARIPVAVVGEARDLTYPVRQLGDGAATLAALSEGRDGFADVLKGAQRPLIIVGAGVLARPDGAAIQAATRALAEAVGAIQPDWIGYSVLQLAAARTGGLEMGFLPRSGGRSTAEILAAARSGAIKVLWLLGADEIDTTGLEDCLVIYQGHHGDRGARSADIILPGAAYTEKDGLYVNTEGRAQRGRAAAFPPGDAREDWKILRALSGAIGQPLPYDSLAALRTRMTRLSPVFNAVDEVVAAPWMALPAPTHGGASIDEAPFLSPIDNYYSTCTLSRASETLALCTKRLLPLTSARRRGDGDDAADGSLQSTRTEGAYGSGSPHPGVPASPA